MDTTHKNLKHDSLSHNRSYLQSKTIDLVSNHTFNHNQEYESRRHHQKLQT